LQQNPKNLLAATKKYSSQEGKIKRRMLHQNFSLGLCCSMESEHTKVEKIEGE